MPKFSKPYQPGAILHEVIVGAFRASGTSFETWCRKNGVHPSTARTATYGQSGGTQGRALLKRIIAAAGEEMVSTAYTKRMIAEASHLSEVTDKAKASN
jgi:lambda repressor-like predicted transcriptional regulator